MIAKVNQIENTLEPTLLRVTRLNVIKNGSCHWSGAKNGSRMWRGEKACRKLRSGCMRNSNEYGGSGDRGGVSREDLGVDDEGP